MSLLIAALAQAVTSAPPEKMDLTIPQPCREQKPSDDEIVVCARRDGELSPYRIGQPPSRQSDVPKAELQLADGVRIGAETEKADVGGFPSNRLMARLKIRF